MRKLQPYILLIDDDVDDIEMFSSELERKGIRVKSFDSSIKALFYLSLMSDNKEPPSLIVMDYNMPKKNGYEVLLLIKKNIDTKDIPVVIYSTSMSNDLKDQLTGAGALDCFDKPWDCRAFNRQVDRFQDLAFHL